MSGGRGRAGAGRCPVRAPAGRGQAPSRRVVPSPKPVVPAPIDNLAAECSLARR